MAETMHPKRNMWVRFIRALRLAEYAKRTGFEKLRDLLDVFYHQRYEVWQGKVDRARKAYDIERTFFLLKQRPGVFARSLFAELLHFGIPEITLEPFKEIVEQVPMRLLFTLSMYAERYFDKNARRSIRTVLGLRKIVAANPNLADYTADEIRHFRDQIEALCLFALERRFRCQPSQHRRIYIDPALYDIPLPLGDRTQHIQDFEPTLMGEKFPLEGDNIRLFMQWGKDLPAQHLDMDLSCQILYADKSENCSFYNLAPTGCRHSGDIRFIPNHVGTAEYINIDLTELRNAQAKYIVFTCNAYSIGGINPNLVLGWMDSKYPMKISDKKGAAYNPSCVIHQVRISHSLHKGLAFGVLDIENDQIIWLELPFDGQLGADLSFDAIQSVLHKLNAKTTVGRLLELKARAQNVICVQDKALANAVYDLHWARKFENINTFFLD